MTAPSGNKEVEIPLRVFLERVVDERDRLYDSRFKAAEIAVTAALAAQEKAVAAAFLASEKAIIKAEEAQKDYNYRSNEFRGQLDDQAKTLMPRFETLGLFKSADDRIEAMRVFMESKLDSRQIASEKNLETMSKEIEAMRVFMDSKLDARRIASDKNQEMMSKDIASLREYRSETTGKGMGLTVAAGGVSFLAGLAVAATTVVLSFLRGPGPALPPQPSAPVYLSQPAPAVVPSIPVIPAIPVAPSPGAH